VIIHEGEEADALYIIVSGRVKVFVANDEGREVILNHHGPGEYVGELPLDGGLRSASVVTTEPTQCVVVTGAELRDFVAANPDFALQLIRGLVRRMRSLTESVRSLALDDVHRRVVQLLQRLSVEQGGVRVVAQRLTQQDIADHVGASREMVGRVLKQLAASGHVELADGRLTIRKPLPPNP